MFVTPQQTNTSKYAVGSLTYQRFKICR